MKHEGSLPHLQVPATRPYPELTGSVHVWNTSLCFVTRYFLQWGVVSTSPNLQAAGSPTVGYPRLFIQYIRSYPPFWRPLLHPKPEDASCRGDRDPLVRGAVVTVLFSVLSVRNCSLSVEVIPQSFQFQAQVTLASLSWCPKWGECTGLVLLNSERWSCDSCAYVVAAVTWLKL